MQNAKFVPVVRTVTFANGKLVTANKVSSLLTLTAMLDNSKVLSALQSK